MPRNIYSGLINFMKSLGALESAFGKQVNCRSWRLQKNPRHLLNDCFTGAEKDASVKSIEAIKQFSYIQESAFGRLSILKCSYFMKVFNFDHFESTLMAPYFLSV